MLCLANPSKSSAATLPSDADSVKCSEDDICIPCRKLVETARHVHVKRTLSFCACIRTRVVEVNLFEDGEFEK
jgi:hypothetical protein